MDDDRRKQLIDRRDARFQLYEMNSMVQEFGRKPWSLMSRDEKLVKVWLMVTFQPYEVLYERELIRQTRGWFRLSLIAALVALGLISVGSLAVINGSITVGLLTGVSSLLPSTVSTMFYARYKWVSERSDNVYLLQTRAKDTQQLDDNVIYPQLEQGVDDEEEPSSAPACES